MKKHIWAITYGLLLVGFTVYVLLDTFVITRVYQVETPEPTQTVQTTAPTQSVPPQTEPVQTEPSGPADTEPAETEPTEPPLIITDNRYSDGNISITITEYREHDTAIYVADVQITSPDYLKTAFAADAYGRNVTEKTSEIAQRKGAILAINGDYYGVREKGYVLRNGILYRKSSDKGREDLVIWKDGSFSVIQEKKITAQELLDQGAQQVLSFGPALILEGEVAVTEWDEVDQAMASNPRAAIGIVKEGHYLFVVSDGRTSESDGLKLYELAQFMQGLGAQLAYNLDGGGSATMIFNGKLINKPISSKGIAKERSVSDIVYIGY